MEKVIRIRKASKKHKKYAATVRGPNGMRVIHFGDSRYQQFKDSTPLRAFKGKDHKDPRRRRN